MREESQLEAWRDHDTIYTLARPHYVQFETMLPFHNWPHAENVANRALAIAQNAVKMGVKLDLDIPYPAGAYHDTGFFLTPGVDHQFASKELFSADVGYSDFKHMGASNQKAKKVHDAIASTQVGVVCKSDEARCLRQADLANICSSNPLVFLDSTWRLYRESKILKGEPLLSIKRSPDAFVKDFVKFCGISYEILNAYNEEDISLGDFDRDKSGVSLFYKKAKRNIDRLVPDLIQSALQGPLGELISYTPV